MNSRGTWNGPSLVLRWTAKVRCQTCSSAAGGTAGFPKPRSEGRPSGALQHHLARFVARFKEGSHRADGPVTGAGQRGADQRPRTGRELIYVKKGARRRTNHDNGVAVARAWCTMVAVASRCSVSGTPGDATTERPSYAVGLPHAASRSQLTDAKNRSWSKAVLLLRMA